MPRIDRRALGAFSRAVAWYCEEHGQLDQYFFEFSLEDYDPRTHDWNATIDQRAVGLARAIEGLEDQVAVELVVQFLSNVPEGYRQDDNILQLLTALEASGLLLEGDRLIPATPGPASMSPTVSKLELDLRSLGYEVALNHYSQAVDNYVAGRHEACNGQIRSFVENLFIEVDRRGSGSSPTNAMSALQHLKQVGAIEDWEFQLFKAYWNGIQDNGPHHGLSDPAESEFRLQTATAISRYLLAQTDVNDA